LIQKTQQNV